MEVITWAALGGDDIDLCERCSDCTSLHPSLIQVRYGAHPGTCEGLRPQCVARRAADAQRAVEADDNWARTYRSGR